MPSPWKDKRTGIYYIRRGVPSDLKPELGSIYKRSLGTKDPKEAKSKFPIALAECNRVFAEARSKVESEPVSQLTKTEIDRLGEAWLSALLEEDDETRMEGLNEHSMRKLQETLDIAEVEARDALARGDTSSFEFEIHDFLESHGIKIEPDSEAYRQTSYALLRAFVKAVGLARQRQEGEPIETPTAPDIGPSVSSSPEGEGEPLSVIYSRWKKERQPRRKLETEADTAFRRFKDIHGDMDITEITRRHVAAFKDALFQLPARPTNAIRAMPVPDVIKLLDRDKQTKRLSAGSVKKNLSLLSAVLEWAVDNGYREDNPASRIRVRVEKSGKDERLPYDDHDLKAIFSSPVFQDGFRPKGGGGEASYWLPILGLYSGARLDELGQLRVHDIKEEEGIHFIDINTNDEGKRLKNKSSKRKIPLHPVWIELGFLEYVEGQRSNKKSDLLFPDLKPDHNGKLTGNYSKWWGRYARELGITDKRKVFHSFRHNFKDACRAAGIGEETHDALTGHSGGGVGRSYGSEGVPLLRLNEAIRKVGYGEQVEQMF